MPASSSWASSMFLAGIVNSRTLLQAASESRWSFCPQCGFAAAGRLNAPAAYMGSRGRIYQARRLKFAAASPLGKVTRLDTGPMGCVGSGLAGPGAAGRGSPFSASAPRCRIGVPFPANCPRAASAIASSGRQLSATRLNTPSGMTGSMPRMRSALSSSSGGPCWQGRQKCAVRPCRSWAMVAASSGQQRRSSIAIEV
jgi:hypothetical protein